MKAGQARVLLTGAAGGIGRAMVEALTARGAQVLGVGRGADGPGAAWLQADVTTAEGQQSIVRAAAGWNANVVVHAAGVPAFGPLAAVPAERLQQVLTTNLLAPMQLTQALLPQLQRLPRAQIVFVGSVLGRIGLPGFSVYGASKAGLQGFAEALRRELGDEPVRVQLLAPRTTRTGFNDAAAQAYNDATGAASDTPEQVAAALVELIESEAAERTLGGAERVFARLNGLLGARMDSGFAKHRRSLAAPAKPIPGHRS
ncbi:short chain dehydrogenase [Rubrivivax gelatinosus]|uniref:SDR family oxidoreductase n=1 Tax=Rubrivivax gelatinosus TaxID=28068 RepID=UPI001902F0F2|nr:SDR family oxidoreductase [Rubrivivax gelatinosus]MBK1615746.1 short chain dehydrogenase [Rubrivivax gelatinosus]